MNKGNAMTVETSTRKQTFSGGQSSLTFTFRTLVSNPEYIKVKLVNTSTDAETDLTYSTDFTVSVNTDGIGGTVTVAPSYSTSYNYVVYRETTAKQESDYDDFNQFPADTLENDLDRNILINQEQQEELTRTLRYPLSASGASTELPAPDADAFLGWNAAGDALENKSLPDPSTLQKATNLEATTGTNDTNYMTPAKVKLQVENSGSVSIPYANLTGIPTTGTSTIINAVYPVGSIYISVVSTNPGTLLGTGTWTAFGTGRTLVGIDAGQTEFDTIEETGGAKTVTLTAAESGLPAHTHTTTLTLTGTGTGTSNVVQQGDNNTQQTPAFTSSSTGGSAASSAHSNLQPYIVVYMWKRTA